MHNEPIAPHLTSANTHLELLVLLKARPLVPVDLTPANPSLRDQFREMRMAGLVDIAREENLDDAPYQILERGRIALDSCDRLVRLDAAATMPSVHTTSEG